MEAIDYAEKPSYSKSSGKVGTGSAANMSMDQTLNELWFSFAIQIPLNILLQLFDTDDSATRNFKLLKSVVRAIFQRDIMPTLDKATRLACSQSERGVTIELQRYSKVEQVGFYLFRLSQESFADLVSNSREQRGRKQPMQDAIELEAKVTVRVVPASSSANEE